jgi:uncharacterized protein involved in exopolysaccharide biosynthesis
MEGNVQNRHPGSQQHGSGTQTTHGELDLGQMARDIFTRRRSIIAFTLGVSILTAICLLLTPNRYTSEARILPSGKGGNLASLGSMIGLSVASFTPDENSSTLYPSILTSRTIQDAVLSQTYPVEIDGERVDANLVSYFGEDNPDLLRQALNACTDISTSPKTGEITVQVETVYPQLSQAVCIEYLSRLEEFNRVKRRSQARENAQYLESQLASTQDALGQAENSLRRYRKANLQWSMTSNPDILYEIGRLDRKAGQLASQYNILQDRYQVALLEARKDVPIIRVLDPPSLPAFKSGPARLTTLVAITLLAAFLATIAAAVAGSIHRRRKHGAVAELANDIHAAYPRTAQVWKRMRSVTLRRPAEKSMHVTANNRDKQNTGREEEPVR